LKRPELYFAVISGIEPTDLSEWDQEEVSNEDMDNFILSCSKGLAEMTKTKDQTIQLIHQSVWGFLLGEKRLKKLQPDSEHSSAGWGQERLKQAYHNYLSI
jgi:hypothetical protein